MQRRSSPALPRSVLIYLLSLSAFIEANGQPLLDVSLYVSFENYRNKTRSAFTRILPWHINYILPPARRAAAQARTVHLGVSSLDMDNVHDDVIDKPSNIAQQNKGQNSFEHETEKRARTLLGRRETVRSMLAKPEYAGAFRLKALADAFFEPLAEVLKGKEYLLDTESPTALDYLAFGYLSLMLYPVMPQAWLAQTLRKQYPQLAEYVERLSTRLDLAVDDATVTALFDTERRADTSKLPWTTPPRQDPMAVVSSIGQDLWRRLPVLGDRQDTIASRSQRDQSMLQRYLPGFLGLMSTVLALGGYFIYHNGLWPTGEAVQLFGRRRLADYGEAGAALAALGGQMQRESAYQHQQAVKVGPVQVDIIDEQIPRV